MDNAPARSAELLAGGRVNAALVPVIAEESTAEDRRSVPRTESDPDRLGTIERLKRPALHFGAADLHTAVGQPDDVHAGVGHKVVRDIGVDHPGEREPVAEVVGHGDGAEPGPCLVAGVRHGTVLQKRPAGPHPWKGGRSAARRPRAPVVTSPPATQGIRRAPIRADVKEESDAGRLIRRGEIMSPSGSDTSQIDRPPDVTGTTSP